MEKQTPVINSGKKKPELVDAAAMLSALDVLNGGPGRRAMQTINDTHGDIPQKHPRHDLADK